MSSKSNLHPVRCVDISYDSVSDMITWELYFIEKDKKQSFAYPSDDLKKALNISAKVSEDEWLVFCKNMQGKNFSLVMPIEEDNHAER